MARTLIEIYLHIVFSTKDRANIIHPEIEAELHRYMAGIVANCGSRCFAINGTENHVHTLVSLGKRIALSDLVREVKKGSTSWLKRRGAVSRDFGWQDGYGGFSMGRSDLPAVRHGHGDRPDALHQELAPALALGPVAEQCLPLLEPRVPAAHPQSLRQLRPRRSGKHRGERSRQFCMATNAAIASAWRELNMPTLRTLTEPRHA